MTLLKRIAGAAVLGGALLLGVGRFASPAQAEYIVFLEPSGNDVVAKGQGVIDLNGLTFEMAAKDTERAAVLPTVGAMAIGPPSLTSAAFYLGLDGPKSFGSGNKGNQADSGSGDFVGVAGAFGRLVVPIDYVSGSLLTDSSTYLNQTLNTLGVTPGIYRWTWGDENENQRFTLV